MRASEIIKRQAELSSKYNQIAKATCMVKLRPMAGIPDRAHPEGRPLHMNVNNPYQFAIRTHEIAANAAAAAWSGYKHTNATDGDCMNSRAPTARLNVERLDQAIPGYSGFVPGLLSENVYTVLLVS